MTPLLEIEGLQAGYGAVQVLWDVTLRMAVPGIACLVGSNGAGKTTLPRTLSGRVAARAGRVVFAGQSVAGNGQLDCFGHRGLGSFAVILTRAVALGSRPLHDNRTLALRPRPHAQLGSHEEVRGAHDKVRLTAVGWPKS